MTESELEELEEQLYEIVANELRSNEISDGLWLKAFSEANGDRQLAKALYAKLRVAQLMREAIKAADEERVPSQEEIRKALAKADYFRKLSKRWRT